MNRLIAWFGAALLCAAPFLIDTTFGKSIACIGLACLTYQAYGLKAYNLIIINIVGILGYMSVILT